MSNVGHEEENNKGKETNEPKQEKNHLQILKGNKQENENKQEEDEKNLTIQTTTEDIEKEAKNQVADIFSETQEEFFGMNTELGEDKPYLDSITLFQMRDVLVEIFYFLSPLEILDCTLVCKAFWVASKSAILWKKKHKYCQELLKLENQTISKFCSHFPKSPIVDFNNTEKIVPNFPFSPEDYRFRRMVFVFDQHLETFLDFVKNPNQYLTGIIFGKSTPDKYVHHRLEKMGDMVCRHFKKLAIYLYTLAQILQHSYLYSSDFTRKLRCKKTRLLIQLDKTILAHVELHYSGSLNSSYFSETAFLRAHLAFLEGQPQNGMAYLYESFNAQHDLQKKLIIENKLISVLNEQNAKNQKFCVQCKKFYEDPTLATKEYIFIALGAKNSCYYHQTSFQYFPHIPLSDRLKEWRSTLVIKKD